MKKIGCRFVALVLIVVFAMGCAGCRLGDEEVTISRGMTENEVFVIGGKSCPLSVMKLLLMNNMNLHSVSYGIDLLKNEDLKVQKKLEQYVKDISMDEITQVYCMIALADERGVELTEEEAEMTSWAGEDYFQSLTKDEISFLGITQEQVQDIYAKYALAEKLYRLLVKDVNEEVSDDEARVMEIRQIYVTDKARAKQALEDLQAEAEFSTVAANYNEAKEIAVTLQRGVLPKEAEDVVFSMENKETSKLVKSGEGYYIFYCDNKYDEELTEIHKSDIVAKRREEAFQEIYEPFVPTIESQLNERVWEQISIQDMERFKSAGFYEIYRKYLEDNRR